MRLRITPFALPIIFFGLVIVLGTMLLHSRFSVEEHISWVDALFTATSATCVTGLIVVDTGSFFTRFGQAVILCLIQVGGLGIMSITGLAFYLLRSRVSLTDRLAVGQSLLHDPNFHLGQFLARMVVWTMLIEAAGACALFILDPAGFTPFSAMFHAVSAFCNAGFSLYLDNLTAWQSNWGVNLVFILLIVLGGIGFSVLIELHSLFFVRRGKNGKRPCRRLSWYSQIVIRTTLALIVGGWLALYAAEYIGFNRELPVSDALLTALFQSVTCRTAGFNTLEINQMTNVSLLLMLMLMLIGGAPGSCAGGIKVTTFRALLAFAGSQLKGSRQAVIGKFAVSRDSLNKALTLVVFVSAILIAATLLLSMTEGGDIPHPEARGLFLEILFEVVSAFCTVGLSTGFTEQLTVAGKLIIISVMFIGRLGPIMFLAALQGLQQEQFYGRPEENMLIG